MSEEQGQVMADLSLHKGQADAGAGSCWRRCDGSP